MKKRAIALTLALCLCLALLPITALATEKTADEAINWVKSQVGHPVGYDDGSGYYQCVEFIQAYYQWLGVDAVRGNGYDYATNELPSGWTRTYGGQPQKGDILVYSKYSDTVQAYGHVAIYESDNVLYDQDGSVYGATVKREEKNYRTYTYNYWGCIHPNFASSASNPSATFVPWENPNWTYIRETDAAIGQYVYYSGGTCTDVGMILYDSAGKRLASGSNGDYYYCVYFKINEELNYTLTPGTLYKYRFFAVIDGKTFYSDYQSFTTLGHSFGAWTQTKAPTCTQKGQETRTCACGAKETRDIPALGHDYKTSVTNPTCTEQGYTLHKCSRCTSSYKDSYTPALGHNDDGGKVTKEAKCTETGICTHSCTRCKVTLSTETLPALGHNFVNGICTRCGAIDPGASTTTKLVISNETARKGETVAVKLNIKEAPALKSMAVTELSYNKNALELVSAEWKLTNSAIASWDPKTESGVIAFADNVDVNKTIMELTFKVKDKAADGDYEISCQLTANKKLSSGAEEAVPVGTEKGKITVVSVLRGDVNGDNLVTSDDAIYLLYHTLMSSLYPINQNGDFNGDGMVTSDDAIYLLYYTLMPALYPLK